MSNRVSVDGNELCIVEASKKQPRRAKLSSVRSATVEGKELTVRFHDADAVALECASDQDARRVLGLIHDHQRGGKDDTQLEAVAVSTAQHQHTEDEDDTRTVNQRQQPVTSRKSRVQPIASAALPLEVRVSRGTMSQAEQQRIQRELLLHPPPLKPGDTHAVNECTRLCDFLYIGGSACAHDRDFLLQEKIRYIVNMTTTDTNDFDENLPDEQQRNDSPTGEAFQNHGGDDVDVNGKRENLSFSSNLSLDDDLSSTRGSFACAAAAALDRELSDHHGAECAGRPSSSSSGQPCKICYLTCPCTDQKNDKMTPYLESIAAFIENARQTKERVLVHCQSGVSRSSSAVLAHQIKHGSNGAPCRLRDAFHWLKGIRYRASPHPTYMYQLCDFEVKILGGEPSLNAPAYENNRWLTATAPELLPGSGNPQSTLALVGQDSPHWHGRKFSDDDAPRFPTSPGEDDDDDANAASSGKDDDDPAKVDEPPPSV